MHIDPSLSHIRTYVSFDLAHDRDLRDRIVEESQKPGSGFEISARSEATAVPDRYEDKTRRRILDADEVIVICGEHTGESVHMSAEIRIAQEESKPYFLLWGRRELMCTKPVGAKPGDSMYSWTSTILRDQIATTLRNAQPREVPDHYKRP
jgi:hypothetical protein